ncbi:MAG: radical SAM protein [Myxococcota bacterium]
MSRRPKDRELKLIRTRLADERGTIRKDAPERLVLLYPSPYRAGMSSLGFQTIYREVNQTPGRVAERAFLPDDAKAFRAARTPLFSYESERPVADFPVVAVSVAYEIELAGLIDCLELASIPVFAEDRDERHPVVLAGGPLTFSNPVPLAPYADAILMGEADETVHQALDILYSGLRRDDALRALASEIDSCFVPSIHGDALPPLGKSSRIPAFAQIVTPHTELRNMFLIEGERGCSRGCAYCVMRRSTNGGMRIVPMEKVLERIPDDVPRVGLVGAAISDHPQIVDLVNTLADQGKEVGLSSLRPDKIKPPFAAALRRAGHRTLTTAMDGASQRLRDTVDRRARIHHLERAATMVREHGFDRLKLYLIVGLPTEEDDDIDELIEFSTELSKIAPISLGIAPFVSKRNTPLDRLPFAGIDVVDRRLKKLRRGVKGRVDVRSTSARWAWVEYVLAQGGIAEGRAVYDAVKSGGRFRDYQQAFSALASPSTKPSRKLEVVR